MADRMEGWARNEYVRELEAKLMLRRQLKAGEIEDAYDAAWPRVDKFGDRIVALAASSPEGVIAKARFALTRLQWLENINPAEPVKDWPPEARALHSLIANLAAGRRHERRDHPLSD